MNESLSLVLAGLGGGVLGAIFFGGLWWTIHKGVLSAQPALWFLASLLVRMGVVLVGFYLIGDGHWERLLACLLGFIAARLLVTFLTGAKLERPGSPEPEGSHAP